MKKVLLMTAILALSSCKDPVSRSDSSRILMIGDSLLDWNGASGTSVSDAIEQALGERVIDRSVVGARYLFPLPVTGSLGMKIQAQFAQGSWDWVVLNGGGNDLWFGCGCNVCDGTIEKLISTDGRSGEIPLFITKLRQTGARVIYVGYLRSPGVTSPIEKCKFWGDELERRIDRFAEQDDGTYFLPLEGLVPYGDRSFHAPDMTHPSPKASAAIGFLVAQFING